jgi:hypothetical protein
MASKVIKCDRCGSELDTEQRLDGNALAAARAAGWLTRNPWEPSAGAPADVCPDCRAKEFYPELLHALRESGVTETVNYVGDEGPNDVVIDGHFDLVALAKRIILLRSK